MVSICLLNFVCMIKAPIAAWSLPSCDLKVLKVKPEFKTCLHNPILIVPSKNITTDYLKTNFKPCFLSNPNIVKDFSHNKA